MQAEVEDGIDQEQHAQPDQHNRSCGNVRPALGHSRGFLAGVRAANIEPGRSGRRA